MSSYSSSIHHPFSDLANSPPMSFSFPPPSNASLSIQPNPQASLSSTSVQIEAAVRSQSPYSIQLSNLDIIGSRFESPPHSGPGRSTYVRQPTRAQLKSNIFDSPKKPFYYKDPSNKEFIDIDGKSHGTRWIMVELSESDGEGISSKKGCSIM